MSYGLQHEITLFYLNFSRKDLVTLKAKLSKLADYS